MIIYIVATWIDLHSCTRLCHHVPFLHPCICIFLDHKVAFVNRIPWPASTSLFPLLRKLRPLHCFLWPLPSSHTGFISTTPESFSGHNVKHSPLSESSITSSAGSNWSTITSNEGWGGGRGVLVFRYSYPSILMISQDVFYLAQLTM